MNTEPAIKRPGWLWEHSVYVPPEAEKVPRSWHGRVRAPVRTRCNEGHLFVENYATGERRCPICRAATRREKTRVKAELTLKRAAARMAQIIEAREARPSKLGRRKWTAVLVAQIVEERKSMTLDALGVRYDTHPAQISWLLKRAKEREQVSA